MQSLPCELLHLIFETVHSDSSYTSYDLIPSSLVNRRWNAVVRRYMFSHIIVSSPPTHAQDAFAAFTDFIDASPQTAGLVKSLKLKIEHRRGECIWDPMFPDHYFQGKFKTTMDTCTLDRMLSKLPSLRKLTLHSVPLASSPTRPTGALYALEEFHATDICCRGTILYGPLFDILSLFSSIEKLELWRIYTDRFRGVTNTTHVGLPRHLVVRNLLLSGLYTPSIYPAFRSTNGARLLTHLTVVVYAGTHFEETAKCLGVVAPNLKSLTLCIGHLLRGMGGTFHVTDSTVTAICAGLPTCTSLHIFELTSRHYIPPHLLLKDLPESHQSQSIQALSTLLIHTPPSVRHLGLDICNARKFPYTLLRLPQLENVNSVYFPMWTEEEDKELALKSMAAECVTARKREISFGTNPDPKCEECTW